MSLATTPTTAATLTSELFGKTLDGRAVGRTTMAAASGVSVTFMSYGGTIIDIVAPDREGRSGHVVLGFPTLREYETVGAQNELCSGATRTGSREVASGSTVATTDSRCPTRLTRSTAALRASTSGSGP